MELKRRRFLATLLGAFAAAAAACRAGAARAAPARWLQALRAGRYPGPPRTFTDADIRRPSRWTG